MAPANMFKIITVLACVYLAQGKPPPRGGSGVTGGMTSDPAATGGMTGSPSGTGGMTDYTDATGGMTDSSNSTGEMTGYTGATGGMTDDSNSTGGVTGYPTGTGGMTGYPTGSYPSGPTTTAAPSSLMSSIFMFVYYYVAALFYKVYCFVTYPFVMLVNALGGGERSLSPVESPEEMYQHASTLAERLNLKKQFQQLERMVEELKA